MRLVKLIDDLPFPEPQSALQEPNGLLAYGGDLSVERLSSAYQQGIFPWFTPGEPILWWSPNPRAVLFLKQLHISRSLHKFLRKNRYRITLNCDFATTIEHCSRYHSDGIWITESMQQAYIALHQEGTAHSVEVWMEKQLVGGLYGIAQGGLFCGESMFSTQTNASKCALVALCLYFITQGGELIDCQILNSHTESLGAVEIPRKDYLAHLKKLQSRIMPDDIWYPRLLT